MTCLELYKNDLTRLNLVYIDFPWPNLTLKVTSLNFILWATKTTKTLCRLSKKYFLFKFKCVISIPFHLPISLQTYLCKVTRKEEEEKKRTSYPILGKIGLLGLLGNIFRKKQTKRKATEKLHVKKWPELLDRLICLGLGIRQRLWTISCFWYFFAIFFFAFSEAPFQQCF